MLKLWVRFLRLWDRDEGAALVEYGLLVGLISIVCIIAITATGVSVNTAFDRIASAVSNL